MPLYLVPTPIGNMQDITLRALKVLFSVDIILAEDTRRTGNLLDFYRKKNPALDNLIQLLNQNNSTENLTYNSQSKPKYISFHEFNENKKFNYILELLTNNQNIALVSDAGTPLISDPGFKLVRECKRKNYKLICLPGPNAAITALTGSGQPPNRFLFIGYLSPKEKRKRKELTQIKTAISTLKKTPTIIVYESPHKLLNTLKIIHDIFGNINLSIASELTKIHEKNLTKPIDQWTIELNQRKNIKGEFTLVFKF